MISDSDRLWDRWAQSKEFRDQYVESQLRQSIPFQVQALLKAHQMTQAEVAKAGGIDQASVSRAADPDYGKLSLTSIARIANGFDVAFLGVFVPFSQLEVWINGLSSLVPAESFTKENSRRRRLAGDANGGLVSMEGSGTVFAALDGILLRVSQKA